MLQYSFGAWTVLNGIARESNNNTRLMASSGTTWVSRQQSG